MRCQNFLLEKQNKLLHLELSEIEGQHDVCKNSLVWNAATSPEYLSGPMYNPIKDSKQEACPKQKRHISSMVGANAMENYEVLPRKT